MTATTEIQEVRFGVHDLKELFPELTQYQFSTLAPLFDRLMTRFIECVTRLGSQRHSMQFLCNSSCTVTDIVPYPTGNGFIFVVNAKIVELTSGSVPLPLRKGSDLYPQGFHDVRLKSNNQNVSEAFFEMIKGFMRYQNLYVFRVEINAEIPNMPQVFPGGKEQKDFYRTVDSEYWVPNMTGGLTPEVVLITLFEYCDAFFPKDWQPILEEIFAAQQEHRFLSLLGLRREEDGKIISPIFDAAIQYLLDHHLIYVKNAEHEVHTERRKSPIHPIYGETRLRVSTIPEAFKEIGKRHHDLIWKPCYNLGRRFTEMFGKKEESQA